MKSVLLTLVFSLFSIHTFASEAPPAKPQTKSTDICSRFMTCGTFVEPIQKDDPKSVETKIIITGTGPMTATFDYVITTQNGESNTWPLTATFTEEGLVTMLWEGKEVYATAICQHNMCNYALIPFESKGRIWGNVGLMRFTDTTLEFSMTVGTPAQNSSHTMIMPKQ